MILIDTSALVASLTGPRTNLPQLREFIEKGERLRVPSLVLYEWWRGPRTKTELAIQAVLLPMEDTIAFGAEEAAIAARLYATRVRPRGREVDLAIAACAITHQAQLWTLNSKDFADIPGIHLAA